MIFLRALIAVLITLALTVVPASVGASAAGMAASAALAASDCSPPCPVTGQMADQMADMAMPGGCHDMDGKSAPISSSACAALCGGLVLALPSNSLAVAGAIAGNLPKPGLQTALAGRMDRPDLPPPRS